MQQPKPTEWIRKGMIDFSQNRNPKFSCNDEQIDENVICFQVVTNDQNDLLSETYTYENSYLLTYRSCCSQCY